ncbi:MAG: Phosphate-binding protein [Chthoniobacteraceae bacterium]|nr:Phosphate-binding protein [Chthoniobacteraceae bacterium]
MKFTYPLFALAGVAVFTFASCSKKTETAGSGAQKQTIANIGSDTMVNLAQAWAESYSTINPNISVEVAGGGSGVGVAALINGTCEIANSSRKLEEEEVEKFKAKHNAEPKEYLVGYDALSIYVHKDNPINEISIEQLSEIFREGGGINKWSELGIAIPAGGNDDIVRISRQSNSGTYHYFREAIVGKKADFKLGSRDMNGSKDVVDLVSHTPNAIGYSGLGYNTPAVKIVKVSKKKGDPGVMPTIETTLDKTYPIARPMFMYTPGTPPAHIQKYLDWIVSDAGQEIVKQIGYVPLPKK